MTYLQQLLDVLTNFDISLKPIIEPQQNSPDFDKDECITDMVFSLDSKVKQQKQNGINIF